MNAVVDWLAGLGLAQYAPRFLENDIDNSLLANLTDQDLKDLGVASVGHRRKMLVAIASLNGAQAKKPRQTAPGLAERRQISVMFCDLVGSTALASRLDPEDMREVIGAYQSACSRIVKAYDGAIAKFMGDGVLAYFGFPRAHEDDAERAVRASLEIVDQIGRLETAAAECLRVRIGIATGLVVIGDLVGEGAAQEEAVVGDTPNLAARLQALAEPNTILVSGATRRLIGELFRIRDAGRHSLKGYATPVQTWAVEAPASPESRFDAVHAARLGGFIGREEESHALLSRFALASAGMGQVVLVSGEAGIGKSRLVAQFSEEIAQRPHTRVRYQCSPYHRDSPLYPFIQQLQRAIEVAAGDSDEAKLRKLETLLRLATPRVHEIAPLFAALLSIPGGARYPALSASSAQLRRRTLAALLDQLEGLARKGPVLVVVEDVHWADATSLEVLDLAIERLKSLPVLMLITFRPEFEPPWAGLQNVTQIGLGRLSGGEVEALAVQVAGGRDFPREVMSQIVAKTDGIPLFVEELTKTIVESSVVLPEGDHYRLSAPLPQLAIPSTLQDSLMARLDRLAPFRHIVQHAAVIGREFSRPLLQAVTGSDEAALDDALGHLEQAGLILRTADAPNARFAFKHALVQDAAYSSLLKNRRQALHRRIAEVMCEKFASKSAAQPEIVAYHYAEAGLNRPAIEWWGRAGENALRRSAFAEAMTDLRRATELADREKEETTDDTVARLRLQIAYGQALLSARGYSVPETAAAFARARELARHIEDPAARFPTYYGLWAASYIRAEIEPMRELAELFLRDAERIPDTPEAHLAHRIYGVNCLVQGDYEGALPHLEIAVRGYDPARDAELAFRFGQDVGVSAMVHLAATLWPLGDVERADVMLHAAFARAIETSHAPSAAVAHFVKWMFALWHREPEKGIAHVRAIAGLAREHGLQLWSAFSGILEGWASWTEGRDADGIAQMHAGIALCRRQAIGLYLPLFQTLLAGAELKAGRPERALAILDDTIAETRQTQQLSRAAETALLRAEAIAACRSDAEAEAAFRAAIDVARGQKVRSFALRAALALANFHRARGRADEARALLEPALAGFSPTLSLPEIAEARALLDSAIPK